MVSRPEDESIQFQRTYTRLRPAHEFAHQWFVDLVTTAWAQSAGLTSAFASWLEVKMSMLHPRLEPPPSWLVRRATAMDADTDHRADDPAADASNDDISKPAFEPHHLPRGSRSSRCSALVWRPIASSMRASALHRGRTRTATNANPPRTSSPLKSSARPA